MLFEDFRFDSSSKELFRADKKVHLRPKAADLLEFFLTHPGEVLSQQRLADVGWPATTVEYEQQVRAVILEIRKALNDDSEHPRLIETVPRRGYRFIAAVNDGSAIPSWPGKSRKYFLLFAATLLLLAVGGLALYSVSTGKNSIDEKTILAVLPARYVGVETANEFPSDGVTHAIIASLTEHQPKALAVIGRTSIQKYKDLDVSLEEIRLKLGAEMVLEASFRKVSERNNEYEASVSLVESATGQVQWSKLASGSLQDIEHEIVSGVLSEFDAEKIVAPRQNDYLTANPEAYDAFIAGLHAAAAREPGSAQKSLKYYQEAAALDPGFWRAHIGIASASTQLNLPKSAIKPALERALEINPFAAEAYFLKAVSAFYTEWDFEKAEENFKKAIELRPGEAKFHVMHSNFLRSMRRFEEATVHGDIALELDPLSEISIGDYEWLFLAQGQYQQAVRFCERALKLRIEYPAREYRCLMLANYELRRYHEAAEYALKYVDTLELEMDPRTRIQNLVGRDRVDAVWRLELERNIAGKNTENRQFQIARGYISIGEFSKALAAIEKSIAAHEDAVVYIAQDPIFVKLKNEPRYQALLRSVNLPRVDG